MCTSGIDIATQHDNPATHSNASARPGDSPNGRSDDDVADPPAAVADAKAGGRPRMNSASTLMLITLNTPIPRYVARQPALCRKCETIGGQIAPAR